MVFCGNMCVGWMVWMVVYGCFGGVGVWLWTHGANVCQMVHSQDGLARSAGFEGELQITFFKGLLHWCRAPWQLRLRQRGGCFSLWCSVYITVKGLGVGMWV